MDVFKVKQKFDVDSDAWWGDHVDVRFFLLKRLRKLASKRVLFVGCNCGVLLSEVENNVDAYGFDIDKDYAKHAKKLASGSKVRVASMYKLPYKANFFDAVVWANVVPGSDFEEPEKKRVKLRKLAMRETLRVLKKGGRLYLTTPNQVRYHSNKLNREELENLVAAYRKKELRVWNPFPDYPHFVPSRLLARLPGWFWLLELLMKWRVLEGRGKAFYVEAIK